MEYVLQPVISAELEVIKATDKDQEWPTDSQAPSLTPS